MNKKYRALTMVEILITVSALGVIAIIALGAFLNNNKMEARKVKLASEQIALGLGTNFDYILQYNKGRSLSEFIDNTGTKPSTIKDASIALRDAYVKYFEGEIDDSCKNLTLPQEITSMKGSSNGYTKTENYACINLRDGMTLGFYLDQNGDDSQPVIKERYTETTSEGILYAKGTFYGYAVYNLTKNSHGILGVDTFTFAFGNKQVKQGTYTK